MKKGTTHGQIHPKNKCQCSPECTEAPLSGEAFCATHLGRCERTSPLTGCEPTYSPPKWNKNPNIRKTHNCYSYAMNVHDPRQIKACKTDPDCNVRTHQPGTVAGYPAFDNTLKTCPEMGSRIRGENPTIMPISFEDRCPPNTSKIALAVDPDQDYHFWRQDDNGWWSGKPGTTPITNKDSTGRPIYDPALCNRDYTEGKSELNYTEFCSYYCVPRKQPLYMRGAARRVAKLGKKAKGRYSSTRRSSGRKERAPPRNQTARKARL